MTTGGNEMVGCRMSMAMELRMTIGNSRWLHDRW